MPQPPNNDQNIEDRAMELARADKLTWVKLPNQAGQPETPTGATNAERDDYRQQASEQIDDERTKGKSPASR